MNKSIHGSLVHVQQERGVTFYFFEHFTSLAWLFLVRLRCFFLEGGGSSYQMNYVKGMTIKCDWINQTFYRRLQYEYN